MATQLNDWLTVDKISGTGNAEITLTASSYEEFVERTASLKIQGISANAILNVRQNAMIPTITLSNNHFNFDYNGGKYLDTTITSNVDWTVKSSDNWFYVSHDYGSKGETVFRVEVTENEGNKREGTITFSYNGEVLATLFITQYGLVSFANDIMTFGHLAETQQNEVLINTSWYIVKDSEWFTVVPSNGSDASNITVSVEENDGLRRTGKISLFTTDGDFFLGEIIVRQKSEFDSQYMWVETAVNAEISAYPAIDYSFDCLTWNRADFFSMDGHNIVYVRKGDEPQAGDGHSVYSFSKFSVGGNPISFGTTLINFFRDRTTLVDASELDISGVTVGYGMFSGCTNLKYSPKTLPSENFKNFGFMFQDCKNLITAPELPATSLPGYYQHNIIVGNIGRVYNFGGCYYYMFKGCTSLTTAPALPATELGEFCYAYMFYGCTSLIEAPELPATTIKEGCYTRMFNDCTSLTSAPALPALNLSYTETIGEGPNGCYYGMFENCTSLRTAPELPATILSESCYGTMFQGCANLRTAPALPATVLAGGCYNAMFKYCASLTTAPELPAPVLVGSCYEAMFMYCEKLNYIKMLATDISANRCLYNWVYYVAPTGTFVKTAGANIPIDSDSGIPYGWTVKEEALVPTIIVSPSNIVAKYDTAAQYHIKVISNVDWTLENVGEWYTINQTSGEKGNTTIYLGIGVNNESEERYGTIKFLYDGVVITTLNIMQKTKPALPKADNRIYYTGSIDTESPKIIYGTNAEFVGYGVEEDVNYIEYDRPITQIMGDFMKGMSVERVGLPSTLLYIYNTNIQNDDNIFGSSAFHTDTLEEVDFGGNELYIGNYAFYSKNLSKFELPSSVRIIGYCGFGGKTTTLNIGANCTHIAGGAFSNNTQLETINFYGANPPHFINAVTGDVGAFSGINEDCVVHAPIGSDYSILYSDGDLPSTCPIIYDLEAVQPTSYETSRFLDGGHIRVNPTKGAIVFYYNSVENKYTLRYKSGKNNYTSSIITNNITADDAIAVMEIRGGQGDVKIEQYSDGINSFYVSSVNRVGINYEWTVQRYDTEEWVYTDGFSLDKTGESITQNGSILYTFTLRRNGNYYNTYNKKYDYIFTFKDNKYGVTREKRFKMI